MPFSTVVGHRHVVELLRKAVRLGRVPQSLVFAGPEGVGKRAVAIALAQALNCPKRADGDGCGKCPTCQRIANGRHSDVTLLDQGDEASIKIDAVRERVLATVGYRPFEAERRVYIIDPADAMGIPAQDALLKTLEEPPSSVVLILVTAYPDTLRPTVLSRCRRLRFGPLDETDVERVLVERCQIDRKDARALAVISGGSVERALGAKSDEVTEDRDLAVALLRAARGPNLGARLQSAVALAAHEKNRRAREALATRCDVVASLLRDLGAMASGSSAALANLDLEHELRGLAPAYDLTRIAAAASVLSEAQRALERQASPKIIADWVAVNI